MIFKSKAVMAVLLLCIVLCVVSSPANAVIRSTQQILNELYDSGKLLSVDQIFNAVYDKGWRPDGIVSVGTKGADYTDIQTAIDAVATRTGWTKTTGVTAATCAVGTCQAADAITITVKRLGLPDVTDTITHGDVAWSIYANSKAFARNINERFGKLGIIAKQTDDNNNAFTIEAIGCVSFTVAYNAALTTRLSGAAPTTTTTDVWTSTTPWLSGTVYVYPGAYPENVTLHSNVRIIGVEQPVLTGDFRVAPGCKCTWQGLGFQVDPTGHPNVVIPCDYDGKSVDLHEYNAEPIREYTPISSTGRVAFVMSTRIGSDTWNYFTSAANIQYWADNAFTVTAGVKVNDIDLDASHIRPDYIRKLNRKCGWEFAPMVESTAENAWPIAKLSIRDALKRYVLQRAVIESLVDERLTDYAADLGPVSTVTDQEWSRQLEWYKPLNLSIRGFLRFFAGSGDLHVGPGGLDAMASVEALDYLPNKVCEAAYQWSSGNYTKETVGVGLVRHGFFGSGPGEYYVANQAGGYVCAALGRLTPKLNVDTTSTNYTFTGYDMATAIASDGLPAIVAGTDYIGNDVVGWRKVTSTSGTTVTIESPFDAAASQTILYNANKLERKLRDFGQTGRETVVQLPTLDLYIHKKLAAIAYKLQKEGALNCVTLSSLLDARQDYDPTANLFPAGDFSNLDDITLPTTSLWTYRCGLVTYGGASIVTNNSKKWLQQAATNMFRIIAWVDPGYTYTISWTQRSESGTATVQAFGAMGRLTFSGFTGESVTRDHTILRTLSTTTAADGETVILKIHMPRDGQRLELFLKPVGGAVLFKDFKVVRG